jgi:ribosome-associated translation inhibitor RaiA
VQSKLMPFLDLLEDAQRDDVKEKIGQLLKNWNDLNSFVQARIPIIELYLRFHQEADHLVNLFNNLEQTLRATKHADELHYIDTVWNKIQTQFTLLKNISKLFAAEKIKVCSGLL